MIVMELSLLFAAIQIGLTGLSLLITLFLATKIIKIDKRISVQGESNIVGGRDVDVG
jgi:hypothetical protein